MAVCFECGAPAEHTHHVVPVARGGTKTVPLCETCHDKVHDRECRRSDTHSQLTKDALAAKKERGESLGPAPYGFVWRGGRHEPVPEQQRTLGRILQLRAGGLSMRSVAKILNVDGVPTRGGGPWRGSTIQGILRRNG